MSKWDSKYLVFEEDDHYEGKTKCIVVVSRHHLNILGEIKWYGSWRQYCFFPLAGMQTVWNTDCLEDVQTVIRDLMEERRQVKRDVEKEAALNAHFIDRRDDDDRSRAELRDL